MTTKTTRALPEKWRLARNLDEGYEVKVDCDTHTDGHWLLITSALHMLAPLKVSSFNLDVPECMGDTSRASSHPEDEWFSRRSAVAV